MKQETKEFIKEHKTEIILGVGVCVLVIACWRLKVKNTKLIKKVDILMDLADNDLMQIGAFHNTIENLMNHGVSMKDILTESEYEIYRHAISPMG